MTQQDILAGFAEILDGNSMTAGFYGHCSVGCLHIRPFVDLSKPDEVARMRTVAVQIKEVRMESVFRYANMFPRAIQLIASGRLDVKPFISRSFAFADGIKAFEEAASGNPTDVKVHIVME